MDNGTKITFEDVRFCYGEVCAVSGVSFSLKKHTLTALVGPNGGGKSTLIKLLAGLMVPDDGSITFDNGITIGYVPQGNGLDDTFPITVREIVLSGTLPNAIRPFFRYTAAQRRTAVWMWMLPKSCI